MNEQQGNSQDIGTPLSEQVLKNYYGGIGQGFNMLTDLKVKCPVSACNFECSTFGEMNRHMRTVHPELC